MERDKIPPDSESIEVGDVQFTHGDISHVVTVFYNHIQSDPILMYPFMSVQDWPEHMKRLTHFWWIKFGGAPYLKNASYDPVTKHFYAGFNEQMLSRWLNLFHEVLMTELNTQQAQLWKNISIRMGQALSVKNQIFKDRMERS